MDGTKRLYVETDDSCAVCGHREQRHLTIHHIDGDSTNNIYDNRIVICWNCHQAHHQGHDPAVDEIRERKRTLIEKTLTQHGVNALKQALRSDTGVVALPFLVYHLVELGYLEERETQMSYGSSVVTKRYTATDEGNRIVVEWNL